MYFNTIEELIAHNKRNGGKFFSPETMRFFDSRILPDIRNTADYTYFITSEQFDANAPRLFTVRKMDSEGRITSASKFGKLKTIEQARYFMNNIE